MLGMTWKLMFSFLKCIPQYQKDIKLLEPVQRRPQDGKGLE